MRQAVILAACLSLFGLPVLAAGPIGIFDNERDIGNVVHAGSAEYDAAERSYTVTGGGENVWAAEDDFHFVWKKVQPGDFSLTADIRFTGTGGNAHRKAMLMIRRTLDKDSDYAGAAVHGNGLASLQSRDVKGSITREVQSNVSAPARVRLLKERDSVFMFAGQGADLHLSGGSMRLAANEPFYVGIGVCAHDIDAVEKVVFSNVDLTFGSPQAGAKALYSTLEVVPVESGVRRAVYVTPARVEAPNWTADSKTLLFNQDGKIWRMGAAGGPAQLVETGGMKMGHHHGISPDGSLLAITDESSAQAAIYALSFAGGAPQRITPLTPSYWKGWSPDGKRVVYTARRDGKLGIYTISAAGGTETAVASGDGTDDDPVYSPDGKYIYFQSHRSGSVQIWRALTDGSQQEQITNDEFANYSPHVSPDGKQVAFLSADKAAPAYPRDTDVKIRSMVLETKAVRVIASLIGGRGSFDAQPWSPDSASLSFVSYQMVSAR